MGRENSNCTDCEKRQHVLLSRTYRRRNAQTVRSAANSKHFRELTPRRFAQKAAHFLSELNAIHPFREGNGRVQLALLILIAERAGHALTLNNLDPEAMLAAMVTSFGGEETKLEKLIEALLRR